VKVDWTPIAMAHLQSAYEYIASDNPSATDRTLEKILEAAEMLERYPNMGRSGRVHGTRELVIANTPYVLPYRVERTRIQVLAVFHASRKWPERL
jgi:toxin ParE1/3/4